MYVKRSKKCIRFVNFKMSNRCQSSSQTRNCLDNWSALCTNSNAPEKKYRCTPAISLHRAIPNNRRLDPDQPISRRNAKIPTKRFLVTKFGFEFYLVVQIFASKFVGLKFKKDKFNKLNVVYQFFRGSTNCSFMRTYLTQNISSGQRKVGVGV